MKYIKGGAVLKEVELKEAPELLWADLFDVGDDRIKNNQGVLMPTRPENYVIPSEQLLWVQEHERCVRKSLSALLNEKVTNLCIRNHWTADFDCAKG
jgi:hypothetical protein